MGQNESDERDYSLRVGRRLRSIRKQKALSMHEVEASSGGEFRASVIGAYERGERAISVIRLSRLAALYGVPVDQLLPTDVVALDTVVDISDIDRARAANSPIIIDLVALAAMPGAEAETLRRYVSRIQVERQDFNGRILSVRRGDLRALGAILGIAPEAVPWQLRELGLTVVELTELGSVR